MTIQTIRQCNLSPWTSPWTCKFDVGDFIDFFANIGEDCLSTFCRECVEEISKHPYFCEENLYYIFFGKWKIEIEFGYASFVNDDKLIPITQGKPVLRFECAPCK